MPITDSTEFTHTHYQRFRINDSEAERDRKNINNGANEIFQSVHTALNWVMCLLCMMPLL